MLGSPLLSDVTLRLGGGGGGASLRIVASNASRANMYVINCTLNGAPVLSPFVEHEQLVAGGTLRFQMSHEPSPTLWRKVEALSS